MGEGFSQDFSQPPEEVQNVVVTPGNGQVHLQWTDAKDPDGVVTGYKIYYGTTSVTDAEQSYADEITLGNVTSYTLNGLSNGTTYYLAITAVDDEGNESQTYSPEVSSIPLAPGGGNPKVIGAEQISNEQVRIVMSKPVRFQRPYDAFIVENSMTFAEVTFIDAIPTDKTVLISFGEGVLIPEEKYRIIATSAVEDMDGNPVSSGITDTVEFQARYIEPPVLQPSLTLPEEIKSPVSPNNFQTPEITPKDVLFPPEELIHSAPVEIPQSDTTSPLDGTGLQIDTSQLESANLVVLKWTPSLDVDGDVADQVLYTRKGLGAWDNGYSLGKTVGELELEVDFNQNYEIRLVTIDSAGNESQGISLAFSTHLAQTGPGEVGTVIALSLVFFMGLFFLGKRRAAY